LKFGTINYNTFLIFVCFLNKDYDDQKGKEKDKKEMDNEEKERQKDKKGADKLLTCCDRKLTRP